MMAMLSLKRVEHSRVMRLAMLHHKWGMGSLLREVFRRLAMLSLERVEHSRIMRLAMLHHKWGMGSVLREVFRRWTLQLIPPLVSSSESEKRPLPHVLSESESDSDTNSHTAMDLFRSVVIPQVTQKNDRRAARCVRKRRSNR